MPTGDDLSGLMRFAGGAAWRGALEEAMADHRGPAMEPFGLEVEAIGGLLGDPWGGVLFGGAFEDRLPRRFEPGGQTLVEDDLKRRGGSAKPPRRRPPCARGWRRRSASPRPARSSPGGRSWRATSSAAASRCASRPGSVQRGDHVSPRNGVASLSLAGEPPGWGRPINVTEHRRRTDGAGLIRALLEGRYREAHEASAQRDAKKLYWTLLESSPTPVPPRAKSL